VTLVLQFVLVKTRWGLHTIATGGNPLGAAEVGIKIARIKIGNFVICSVLGDLQALTPFASAGSICLGGTEIMLWRSHLVLSAEPLTEASTIIGAFLGAAVPGILKDGYAQGSAHTFQRFWEAQSSSRCCHVHLSACAQREADNE
jgi:simple sugar transport system permease protein